MRGGALAFARIRHFGVARSNAELSLMNIDGLPLWLAAKEENTGEVVDTSALLVHFSIFLGV